MSDVMLLGVLRMPYDMAMGDELSRRQFYARAQEAAARMEGLDSDQWLPIESAPMDGTTIIVGRDMGDFGFVRGYAHYAGARGAYVSGWISRGFTDPPGDLGLAHPTLWMPLPPPPADQRTPEQTEQEAKES